MTVHTLESIAASIQAHHDDLDKTMAETHARLLAIEQTAASRSRGGGFMPEATWGATLTDAAEFKNWQAGNYHGKARIKVSNTLTTAGGSAGAGVVPQRDPVIVPSVHRRLKVRALLAPGRTDTGLVQYVRVTGFTNNAGMVAEGAQKPQSDLTMELVDSKARTVAHWIPASRQVMDDVPQLQTLVDTELRYGLDYVEEAQMLAGDGTGENLYGMIPQATAFNDALRQVDDNQIDTVARALAQAEIAELPSSGVILNTQDWFSIITQKDANGRYIFGDPAMVTGLQIWGVPVVYTNALPLGHFLAGAFSTAVQIYDRMDTEVLVSDEDRDNFIKNMLTIRAEKRLAMAVKRPQALIYGAYDAA